jgi:hypothetical protein
MEGLRKTLKYFNQDSGFPGRYLTGDLSYIKKE